MADYAVILNDSDDEPRRVYVHHDPAVYDYLMASGRREGKAEPNVELVDGIQWVHVPTPERQPLTWHHFAYWALSVLLWLLGGSEEREEAVPSSDVPVEAPSEAPRAVGVPGRPSGWSTPRLSEFLAWQPTVAPASVYDEGDTRLLQLDLLCYLIDTTPRDGRKTAPASKRAKEWGSASSLPGTTQALGSAIYKELCGIGILDPVQRKKNGTTGSGGLHGYTVPEDAMDRFAVRHGFRAYRGR